MIGANEGRKMVEAAWRMIGPGGELAQLAHTLFGPLELVSWRGRWRLGRGGEVVGMEGRWMDGRGPRDSD